MEGFRSRGDDADVLADIVCYVLQEKKDNYRKNSSTQEEKIQTRHRKKARQKYQFSCNLCLERFPSSGLFTLFLHAATTTDTIESCYCGAGTIELPLIHISSKAGEVNVGYAG